LPTRTRDSARGAGPLLRAALASPQVMATQTRREWDLLLRQARAAALVGRLANVIEAEGLVGAVPAEAWRHFAGQRSFAARLAHDVRLELERIAAPLRGAGSAIILLKGAGYVAGNLPPAEGREFSDIDIMVPEAELATAERRLKLAGWQSKALDRWDERFYRAWMHEVPALIHPVRESVIDLHHTIVPRTARIRLAAHLLFEAARSVGADPALKVLAPADMVLHSATHLFNEGTFGRALRDLADIDLLLRHFGRNPDFWSGFLARAEQLDLGRPAYYALRYAARLLRTPVPAAILRQSARFAPAAPRLMDFLFERALRPPHPSCRDRGTRLALFLLYLRAHALRLPLRLLIPHLLRKSWKRSLTAAALDQPDLPGVNH
jgi:Uncharacterised nucleotidyltransferase